MLLIATLRMSCSARTQTSRLGQVNWSAGFIAPSFTASSEPHERMHDRRSAAEAPTWMWAMVSFRTLHSAVGQTPTAGSLARISTCTLRRLTSISFQMK